MAAGSTCAGPFTYPFGICNPYLPMSLSQQTCNDLCAALQSSASSTASPLSSSSSSDDAFYCCLNPGISACYGPYTNPLSCPPNVAKATTLDACNALCGPPQSASSSSISSTTGTYCCMTAGTVCAGPFPYTFGICDAALPMSVDQRSCNAACAALPGSSSAPASSASSQNRCFGTECFDVGAAQCLAQGKTCQPIFPLPNGAPCFTCEGLTVSSSSISSSASSRSSFDSSTCDDLLPPALPGCQWTCQNEQLCKDCTEVCQSSSSVQSSNSSTNSSGSCTIDANCPSGEHCLQNTCTSCDGLSCALGGSAVCAEFSMDCLNTAEEPLCMSCVKNCDDLLPPALPGCQWTCQNEQLCKDCTEVCQSSSSAPPSNSSGSCTLDANCPSGERCLQNTCTSCDGLACALGGSAVCANFGMDCQVTAEQPLCMSCVQAGSASSARSGASSSTEACTGDANCPSGICEQGTCQAPECTYDEDCPIDFICRSYRCIPRCTNNNQCASNQECRDGECVQPCATDDQCTNGLQCTNGICQPVECQSDSQCPDGMCVDGRCQPPECRADADCGPDGRCRNNRCRSTCIGDTDCRGGQCKRGICYAGNNSQCTSGDECVSGLCANLVCGSCANSAQCPAGRSCKNGVCSAETCGNGVREGAEACDDGNSVDTDGCTRDCRLSEGTECASNDQCATGVCTGGICKPCMQDRQCGSGLCLGTQCSGGPQCGNGALNAHEECDDGNRRGGDGCSNDCLLERGSCGDGIVETLLDEQCEPTLWDKAQSKEVRCDPGTCRLVSLTCGNNNVEKAEQCDRGKGNSNAPSRSPQTDCRLDCSRPRCGDRIVDVGETCDDGNRVDGDGCSRSCQLEHGTSQVGSLMREVFDLGRSGTGSTLAGPNGTAKTGPGVLGAMAAGAAAGWSWLKRRRKQ